MVVVHYQGQREGAPVVVVGDCGVPRRIVWHQQSVFCVHDDDAVLCAVVLELAMDG